MRKLAALILLLRCLPSQAQTIASQVPVPTIRANTRMILVSVVATDPSGQVTSLTAQDFSLLEDGKPQKLSAFAFEKPTLSEQSAAPPLPPNVFTNRPSFLTPAGPLTILLLDTLNTPEKDQLYVKRELLRYLRHDVQPGQSLAVFALGSQLHLLQNFTSDRALLRSAVERVALETSHELALEQFSAPPPPKDVHSAAAYLEMLRVLKELFAERGQIAVNQRVSETLTAFRTIASSVAGYPGRKNLVWVSGAFPFSFQVEMAMSFERSNIAFYRTYEREIRRVANLMGDAQISIYPVDAGGLVGAEVMDASQPLSDELGRAYGGATLGEVVNRSSQERLNSQASMEEVANLTGGRAFINRNDIDQAVALSVADGSSYYTLAYYPTDKNWHGQFRKINIKVARKGVHLRYRNGYYAVDAHETPQTRDAELAQALRSEGLPATMVVFDAKVLPAALSLAASTGLARPYRIDFMVDTRTLSSEPMLDGGRHFNLEFHAVAFSPDGTLIAHVDTQLNSWAGHSNYEEIRVQGLPFQTRLQLPVGHYQLRLVVRDVRTGFLGSLDVPVAVDDPAKPN